MKKILLTIISIAAVFAIGYTTYAQTLKPSTSNPLLEAKLVFFRTYVRFDISSSTQSTPIPNQLIREVMTATSTQAVFKLQREFTKNRKDFRNSSSTFDTKRFHPASKVQTSVITEPTIDIPINASSTEEISSTTPETQ